MQVMLLIWQSRGRRPSVAWVERRPRTKPRNERRGDLLDAAELVLVDRGMAAFTVDEVTSRADVAKGTFYLYFQSKEDVLAALRERFLVELVRTQVGALDQLPDGEWLGRLELWMESSIRGYLANVRLHDALFMHAPSEADGRGPVHPTNQHFQLLSDILHAGSEAGAFTVTSPMAAAVLLYAAMHGATDYLIDNLDDPADPADITVDELVAEARLLCRKLTTS